MENAFIAGVEMLVDKFGEDMKMWQWGQLHRMHYRHSFSGTPLAPFFHRSYPSHGTRRNLNVAGYYLDDDFSFKGVHSGNLRVVVELGGPSFWSIDMGISGVKGSKHYDDIHELHEKGEYVEMRHGEKGP